MIEIRSMEVCFDLFSKVSGGGPNVQRIKNVILQSNPLLEVISIIASNES